MHRRSFLGRALAVVAGVFGLGAVAPAKSCSASEGPKCVTDYACVGPGRFFRVDVWPRFRVGKDEEGRQHWQTIVRVEGDRWATLSEMHAVVSKAMPKRVPGMRRMRYVRRDDFTYKLVQLVIRDREV